MVEAGDREHPQHIQTSGNADGLPAPADPEDAQASQVDPDERHDPEPVDPLLLLGIIDVRRMRVEPEADRVEKPGDVERSRTQQWLPVEEKVVACRWKVSWRTGLRKSECWTCRPRFSWAALARI